MITTVCLNPALDKTATIPRLTPGEAHRLETLRYDVAGKGLNVARTLRRLGVEAACVGLLSNQGQEGFLALLAADGLAFPHVTVPGRIRSNLKVLDENSGQVTEFNELGPTLEPRQLRQFLALLRHEARGSVYVTLSGSLPPGCEPGVYAQCMQALPDSSFVLDAIGEALLLGLAEKPLLVKPNLRELEEAVGRKLPTLPSIREAACSLVKRGARHVLVSLGSQGALLTDGTRTVFAPGLPVKTGSTVGAGDGMVAGMLAGLCQGKGMFEALRWGVAAGAASAMTRGTDPLRPEDFQALLPQATWREV